MIATGTARRVVRTCLVLVAGVAAGCGGGKSTGTPKPTDPPLLCCVDETARPAMESLAADYEKQTGRNVEIDPADSAELLTRIAARRQGDLAVGHDPFQARLAARGMSRRGWTVAVLTPVIAVRKDNPETILSVRDLARPGLRLVMPDAAHSTAGRVLPAIFAKVALRKQIETNIVERTRNCAEAAESVASGDANAAIVWNAVVRAPKRRARLDTVEIDLAFRPIPGVDAVAGPEGRSCNLATVRVTIDLLTCSKQPEAARRFAEFVLNRTSVLTDEFGLSPAPATARAETLRIHCAAALRPAMADAATAFAKDTGAALRVSYAASGTLIAAIKLKRHGDLYLPDDAWYLDQLDRGPGKLLDQRRVVCRFVPVILVRKGNPKAIATLGDLLADGVRLGVGNPRTCRIGRVGEQVFAAGKVDPKAVARRTAFSATTVDELAAKVQAGAIDAAIVWDTTAARFAGNLDTVGIPPEQNVVRHLAVGLLSCSGNKPLAGRFMDFLASPEGEAIFARYPHLAEASR